MKVGNLDVVPIIDGTARLPIGMAVTNTRGSAGARSPRPRATQLTPRNIRLIPRNNPITHSADAGHSCQIIKPRIKSMIPLAKGQPHAPNR